MQYTETKLYFSISKTSVSYPEAFRSTLVLLMVILELCFHPGAMDALPLAMETHPKSWDLTLEPWRVIVEI
jgi:hypothetical protein